MISKLLSFDANSPYFDAAVAIYSEYATHGEPQTHRVFFLEHSARADYIGLVVQMDSKIVGVTFGSRSRPSNWWHEKVAEQVGDDHPALQDAWVLTQLNVLAAYRNRGVGTQLHDAILAQQPCCKALLSTPVTNTAAQRFYQRYGWRVLHPGFAFSTGDEPYTILHRTLDSGAKAGC